MSPFWSPLKQQMPCKLFTYKALPYLSVAGTGLEPLKSPLVTYAHLLPHSH
jgi:hypothetical protein